MSNDTKIPFKTLRPLGISGRVEKGQVVYLTADEARAYSANDLIPLSASVETPVTEDVRALDELSLSELRVKAKDLGLTTSGSKADLIERIQLAAQN